MVRLGLKAGVAVPLKAKGTILGMLAFGQLTRERSWNDTILQRLKLVGEVIANALAHARADESLCASREEARQLAGRLLTAQEDERKRLAREMHDDVSQRLAATAIEAGKFEQQFPVADPSREAMASLKDHLIALSDDVHRISRQLHPAILDDLGLEDAIRSECDRFAEREGVAIQFHCGDLPDRLPKDIALCLYRIAQEALRNVAKHAQTRSRRTGAECGSRVPGSGGSGLRPRISFRKRSVDSPAWVWPAWRSGPGLSAAKSRFRRFRARGHPSQSVFRSRRKTHEPPANSRGR